MALSLLTIPAPMASVIVTSVIVALAQGLVRSLPSHTAAVRPMVMRLSVPMDQVIMVSDILLPVIAILYIVVPPA
jgi:hypothetical protein